MRAFISGPITGTQDFRERFREAAERLNRLGVTYCNPGELYKSMPDASHADYVEVCKRMLCTCDFVVVLPGFADSEGCREEFRLAKKLGLPIYLDAQSKEPLYEDATTL